MGNNLKRAVYYGEYKRHIIGEITPGRYGLILGQQLYTETVKGTKLKKTPAKLEDELLTRRERAELRKK
jgi:hypothetical protein